MSKEHVEVVLGPARPPRTPPNLAGRHDGQQGRDKRGYNVVVDVFFTIGRWDPQSAVIHSYI